MFASDSSFIAVGRKPLGVDRPNVGTIVPIVHGTVGTIVPIVHRTVGTIVPIVHRLSFSHRRACALPLRKVALPLRKTALAMCWLLMAVFASTVVAQAKPTILPSEAIQVGDRPGFIFWPEESLRQTPQPWVFYAPTLLPQYPDSHEKWMHEQFLAAGIAVAGLDVGEAYGNPAANQAFDQLYAMLIEKYKFAPRPCVLGRSRGGLWVSSWAAAHPERIAGLAGIYPVFDITSYPGLGKAAPAYQLSPEALQAKLLELNPIENVSRLTKAKIPVCIIHGAVDKVVPIEPILSVCWKRTVRKVRRILCN